MYTLYKPNRLPTIKYNTINVTNFTAPEAHMDNHMFFLLNAEIFEYPQFKQSRRADKPQRGPKVYPYHTRIRNFNYE